ncbi:hypothetical protein BH10ACT1_BH10ACT1_21320 [soil metagenome]
MQERKVGEWHPLGDVDDELTAVDPLDELRELVRS